MDLPKELAAHFRAIYFGGSWSGSSINFKEQLTDVTWQQATAPVYGLNTIAALVFHINYFVGGGHSVLTGGRLEIKDKFSFDHPPIRSAKDWEELVAQTFEDAEAFAKILEQLPESKLGEDFWEGKYGIFHRNIWGLIEHNHYHLGQIVLLKKILAQQPL